MQSSMQESSRKIPELAARSRAFTPTNFGLAPALGNTPARWIGGDFPKTPKAATERTSCLQALLGAQPRPSSSSPRGRAATEPHACAAAPPFRRETGAPASAGFALSKSRLHPNPSSGEGAQRRPYPYSATCPHPHPVPVHGPVAQACSPATDGEKREGRKESRSHWQATCCTWAEVRRASRQSQPSFQETPDTGQDNSASQQVLSQLTCG